MPSPVARAVLFLSSYAPLFVVLAIRGMHRDTLALTAGLALCGIAVLSVSVLRYWIGKAQTFAPFPTTVARASPRDDLAVAYIVTYILPFAGVNLSSGRDLAALVLIFAITLLVAVRTNLFYVNPILNLLGYHIHEVEDAAGRFIALISKRSYLKPGAVIPTVPMDRHSHVRIERI
jgi:hypothetical protein